MRRPDAHLLASHGEYGGHQAVGIAVDVTVVPRQAVWDDVDSRPPQQASVVPGEADRRSGDEARVTHHPQRGRQTEKCPRRLVAPGRRAVDVLVPVGRDQLLDRENVRLLPTQQRGQLSVPGSVPGIDAVEIEKVGGDEGKDGDASLLLFAGLLSPNPRGPGALTADCRRPGRPPASRRPSGGRTARPHQVSAHAPCRSPARAGPATGC